MTDPTGYCDVDDDVKPILRIDSEDTTYDTELEAAVTTSDALVDALLAKNELTVPTSVPQLIVDASAHFAAWLFRRRRDPTGAIAFLDEANKLLDTYMDSLTESPIEIITDDEIDETDDSVI